MSFISTQKFTHFSITLFLSVSLMVVPLKSNANELIEGFAQWQANRVERILLDQAIFGLIEDEYVKAFFPLTTEAVGSYSNSTSAERLIPLIQAMIDRDITNIEDTFTVDIKNYLDIVVQQFEAGDTATALSNLQQFEAELKKAKSSITKAKWFTDFTNFVNQGPAMMGKTVSADITSLSNQSVASKISSTQAGTVLNSVDDFISNRTEYEKNNNLKPEQQLLEARLQTMVELIQQYEQSRDSYKNATDKKAVIAIHFFVRFFELFGSENDNYTQFKSLGLFLAALIEADNASAVTGVLDSFVDEQAAYRNKRLDANNSLYSWRILPSFNSLEGEIRPTYYTGHCFACPKTLFVGSYFGAALGKLPDEETFEQGYNIRAFGPVGIEYKILSIYGAPVTLTYAPIDVGNYVSNELRDIEYTAKFSDIVAPSLFVSYSFANKPFAVNFGYQKDIKIGNEIEENTWFLSFTFDLPIYTIY